MRINKTKVGGVPSPGGMSKREVGQIAGYLSAEQAA